MKTSVPVLVLVLSVVPFGFGGLLGCGGDSGGGTPQVDCTSVADTTQPTTVSFQDDIRPLFLSADNGGYGCGDSDCHGGVLISSDFRVDTYGDLFHRGEEARALGFCSIRPGDPGESYIYMKVSADSRIAGESMPLEMPLMDAQDRENLRVWILEGARDN